MNILYLAAALALLVSILLGLGHVFRQPGRADSLLAALLFGSTGVALVLVLALEQDNSTLAADLGRFVLTRTLIQ